MTPDRTRPESRKYKGIEHQLQKIRFEEHVLRSGFKRRKARKISGRDLLVSFILMAMQGKNTFQHWSEQLGLLLGTTVSRQAIWKRVNDRLTRFLMSVMFDVLSEHTRTAHSQATGLVGPGRYARILVQDSTVIGLPDALSQFFPGSVSRGKKKALLKIQAVYDLLGDRFVHFGLTPYTDNDQSRSKDILSIASKGDMVIRDLGYFAMNCFAQMMSRGVCFISRMRSGVILFDPVTGKESDLLRILRRTGHFDQKVLVGRDQRTELRVVAVKLPEGQAEQRIRKARQDRDKRLNHSKEYYELLGYSVYMTSESADDLSVKQIVALYGCRWRIETIFKCWKSHFNLQKVMPQNVSLTKERAEAIIYMMLIFILLFQVNVYDQVLRQAQADTDRVVSLVKLCQYVAQNIWLFLTTDHQELIKGIFYYCCYDRRRNRLNFIQKSKLG